MMRLAFFLTTLLTTFLGYMFVTDLADEKEISVTEALLQDRRVGEMSVRYYHFKGSFQATIDALARGELKLREARARILALAREHNPNYLEHLVIAEIGATDEERLARNLVAHVCFNEEVTPNPKSHLAELQAELDQLLREIQASKPTAAVGQSR